MILKIIGIFAKITAGFCKNCIILLSRVARWFVFKPKFQFGYIIEGLRMKNTCVFYGHLEYFTLMTIW
jgi:hypothetical protein